MSTPSDPLAIFRDPTSLLDEDAEFASRLTALESGGTGGLKVIANGDIEYADPELDALGRIVIHGDGTDSSTWPDRWVWCFVRPGETRIRPVFIVNENGEARFIPAKNGSTPLTVYGKDWDSDPDNTGLIFEVAHSRESKLTEWGVKNDGTVMRRTHVDSPVYVAGATENVAALNPPLADGTVVLRKS